MKGSDLAAVADMALERFFRDGEEQDGRYEMLDDTSPRKVGLHVVTRDNKNFEKDLAVIVAKKS